MQAPRHAAGQARALAQTAGQPANLVMPRTKEGTNHAKPAACSQTAVFRAMQKNAVHEQASCRILHGQGVPRLAD